MGGEAIKRLPHPAYSGMHSSCYTPDATVTIRTRDALTFETAPPNQ